MRVEIVRRGGIMGIQIRSVVDTAELPAAISDKAEVALKALPFGREPAPPAHPDSFQFEIAVGSGDTQRSVLLNEADLTPDLRPLIDAAMKRGELD